MAREKIEPRDTVVWHTIRDALQPSLPPWQAPLAADAVNDALLKVDVHALAGHFQLPVALSGSEAFDQAVFRQVELHVNRERDQIAAWLEWAAEADPFVSLPLGGDASDALRQVARQVARQLRAEEDREMVAMGHVPPALPRPEDAARVQKGDARG